MEGGFGGEVEEAFHFGGGDLPGCVHVCLCVWGCVGACVWYGWVGNVGEGGVLEG